MVVQTKNNDKVKSGASVADEIAACLFYQKSGTKIQFEAASPDIQEDSRKKAIAVLQHIDKMGLTLGKVVDKQAAEQKRRKDVDELTICIKGFVSGLKSIKPALFPAEELAHKILDS